MYFFHRYTADEDGYHADVSYLINKNSNLERTKFLGDADYEINLISPVESTLPINIINLKDTDADDEPLSLLHQPGYHNGGLSLEERKSISAKPTYIVSSKSTHINTENSERYTS